MLWPSRWKGGPAVGQSQRQRLTIAAPLRLSWYQQPEYSSDLDGAPLRVVVPQMWHVQAPRRQLSLPPVTFLLAVFVLQAVAGAREPGGARRWEGKRVTLSFRRSSWQLLPAAEAPAKPS